MNRRSLITAAGAVGAALLSARGTAARALERLAAQGDWNALAGDYGLDPAIVYLNHASIGTTPAPLTAARLEYLRLCETNPWLYMWGGAWEEAREETRAAAAELLGCAAADVAITHNTTEGFSLLAQGLPLGPGDEVLYSSLNHAGASVAWEQQAARRGFSVRRFDFPVTEGAGLTVDDVVALHAEAVSDATRVLVFPHVDNIVGLRHPLAAMSAMAHAAGVEYVAVDGAQTAGMIPLALAESGVDFYATSGHKWIQGPKGTGLMYLREAARAGLEPMWTSWGQARWQGTARVYEDYGTRNLAETLVLGDAIRFQQRLGAARVERRLEEIRKRTRAYVEAHPRLRWRSPRSWRDGASLYGVSIEGIEAATASERLYAEDGIVLRPFGGELQALRLSPNVITTEAEIAAFVQAASAL